MKPALVIVDMQKYFLERGGTVNAEVIDVVVRRLREAKKRGEVVFSVTYDGAGENCEKVSDELRGYFNVVRVRKGQDDGAGRIKLAMIKRGVKVTKFSLVGVNLGYCVLETCKGLRKLGYDARIDKSATNTHGSERVEAKYYKKQRSKQL